MNSEFFFRNTHNIASFGSSFLNDKSPQIYKIFKEIFEQIAIPSLNNKQNGFPTLESAKKPSFCSDFSTRFNNLFGFFNYEFCYMVIKKINIKKCLYNLINEQQIKNAIILYNNSKLKFLNSVSFRTQFKETDFYNFHFCNENIKDIRENVENIKDIREDVPNIKNVPNIRENVPNIRENVLDIQPDLLRKMIFDKIIGDIANVSIQNREDVYNESSKVLKLIIDDSIENRNIKLTLNDFKSTPFFRTASRLQLDFERIKTTLNLYGLINDELKPNMSDVNFPYLIDLIKSNYEGYTISYDPIMLDIIINYFIELSITLHREIIMIVGFEKSSRIQLVHILKSVANVPYANLKPDQMQAIHYALFTSDDISKGYELVQKK